MTREVGDRILKDANGDISDHLRNHIHLTNCIHLKNHMHKHSPILSDRSLIRDLAVLQRSRSLRDPSMSPPSWNSPSAIDLLSKRGEKDAALGNGRRSVDMERRGANRGFSGSSPLLASLPRSKVGPGEVSRRNDVAAPMSDRSKKSGVRETRKVKKEESSGRKMGTETKDKDDKQVRRHREDNRHLKTLSERLNEVRLDTDDVASSRIRSHGRHTHPEKPAEEAEETIRSSCSGLNRVKRRKFRGARRNRACQNEIPMASNSLAQGAVLRKYHMEGREEECAEQNVTRAPQNGCGIPWNWSRIHHRGKNFLDIAGRSLSCGLSDPKLKKGGQVPRERDFSDVPDMNSDCSSSSSKPNAEALPLLVDASGSLESTDNAAWVHDYSGELGIFADNLLKHEIDGTDLASEARSSDQPELRGHLNGSRHQNFTQKYMPRTFRDLVGQNLVAQALSNAVTKRKVGLLYVFYGPHGTGKTACARILARALNCQSLDHPKPCGFCDSCISYDMSKSRNIREIGSAGNFDFESIMDLLDNMIVSQLPSQYRVVIFDDCGNLSPDCWGAISKVIDRGPRHVVFVLVCLSLDVLPHIIISRCQKFFFPKLKDADIIYTLQWIATKEELEIDKDALKLIASRSDGSLRDAEMTLDQLSLLGQRISVPLVQELVGLISDEKLVDLLDLALSADTINTVKNLREIMESGVEPLALMSQLATVITDILAGSYDFVKVRPRRKFFRQQGLSKEDMEKLRQALKTLSEAEKQLRMSNDRLTWLTAALLQLAPDQQYLLPSPSANSSLNFSPVGLSNDDQRDRPRRSNAEMANNERRLPTNVRIENLQQTSGGSGDKNRVGPRRLPDKLQKKIEEVWLEVLEKIQINSVKQFMYQEGKLISVSFGAAPTVELMFSSYLTKSKAEKFRMHISCAFESVLGSPVTIEIRYESKKDTRAGNKGPLRLTPSQDMMMSAEGYDDISRRQLRIRDHLAQAQLLHFDSTRLGRSEIVEIEASPVEPKGNEHLDDTQPDRRKPEEQNQSQSLVRSKVSLSHVIQQGEGCTQISGWSKRKAVSIAEKLEQENLRLEPRSRSLLCWRASRVTRRKLSRFKIRARKPQALLRYVSCGKCLSARSPR